MIGRFKGNLYEVDLVNNEILPLPPAIDCEDLQIPLPGVYGYLWMASFQKNYKIVYVPLPKPGPKLGIPHVASISVINRHISRSTILNDEIYKYVASNLDFSENTKEITAKLGTGIRDVDKKIEKALEILNVWSNDYSFCDSVDNSGKGTKMFKCM